MFVLPSCIRGECFGWMSGAPKKVTGRMLRWWQCVEGRSEASEHFFATPRPMSFRDCGFTQEIVTMTTQGMS